jgi:putative transcriptional regulator
MAKRAFDRIMRGVDSARAFAAGTAGRAGCRVHVPRRVNVRAIRRNLGLSQHEFSARFGISLHTLRKWEQRGRSPEGPARAYLRVIERNPRAVDEALRGAP